MATINGNNRNNFLRGTNSADTISGRGGNDVINGRAGSDRISGGSGNDSIDGGRGNDSIDGGRGNDSIDGGSGLDLIDFSDATGGINFTLVQSSSWTTVNLSGVGLGTDTYKNIEGVIGTNFNDRITGSSLDDKIYAGGGNDTVNGLGGNDWIDAGSGNDSVDGGDGNDTIYGGSGNDSLLGGMGNDWINAGNDNDTVDGGAGNDTIYGGSGNDSIDGGSGSDVIDGGSGDDSVVMLVTTGNVDTIDAGIGIDTLVLTGTVGGTGVLIADLSSTTDQVVSIGGVADALVQKNFENLDASGLGSSIYATGSSGADVMTGSAGNDTLSGGAGNDTIFGGAGNDSLIGGSGADQFTGGSGQDHFVYLLATDSPAAGPLDSILDFTLGQDKIDLAAFRGADDLIWRGEDPAVPGPWEVWYHNDTTSTFVFADTNGDGVPDVKIELRNTPGLNLESSDFIGVAGAQGNAAPVITSGTTGTEAENTVNTNVVYTATATDPDAGDSIAWSLTGADASLFTIDSDDGEVRFNASPNYEAPADAGFNNVYDIVVHASDGTLEDTQAVAITVTDVNAAPVITSGDTGSEAENTATANVVYDASATDDGENSGTLTFSLTGTDASLFTIDSDDGEVRFNASPNYEAPADAGANNVYDIVVHASDGTLEDTQAVAITVTDANDVAPVITSGATGSEAENTATSNVVYDANATDPDTVGTVSFSLTGPDATLFSIDSDDGEVRFLASPNYEAPADTGGNNVYDVVVHANDGVHDTTQAVTIAVTDVNDAPVANSAPVVAGTDVTGAVTELVTPVGNLTDSGTIAFTDVDLTDIHSVSAVTPSSGALGTLIASVSTDTTGSGVGGVVTWNYSVAAANVEFLAAGQHQIETFTFDVLDGQGGSVSRTVSVDITGTNDAAVLSSATISLDETDAVLSTGGTLTISDADSEASFVAQSGTEGDFGTFSIDTAGVWSYTAGSAFDDLNVGDSVSDTFTVTSADGTPTTVQVTITGTNDAAVLSSATISLDETDAVLSTGGTLTISDADSEASFVAQSGTEGDFGTFSIDTAGVWSYTAGSAFDDLNVGDSVSDTFTVTSADGTPTTVQVTITGTNDAAVLSSATISLDETDAVLSTGGTLTISDADSEASFVAQSGTEGDFGTFSIDTAGVWSYTAGSAFDDLNVGDSVSDTFTVTSADGTPTTVQVTITGTNDAAVLSSATISLDETDAVLSTGGTLTISDADSEASFVAQSGTEGDFGTFSIDTAGVWSYTAGSAFDDLNVGDSVSDTFTVTSADGTPTTVQVTITGTNDAAVLSSATISLDETDAVLSTGGTLTISDADSEASFVAQSGTEGDFGTFSIDTAGVWSYTAGSAFDDLNVGDSVSDTFTVTSADGTPTTVQVTITGTNDAAVLSSATISLDETDAVLSTGGTLTISDADSEASFVAQSGTEGDFGTFSIDTAGVWSYTAGSAFDDLNVGDSVSDTFTVTSADGTPTTVQVTITGTNDAALITGTATDAVTEAGGVNNGTPGDATAVGDLDATDVDSLATFVAQTNLATSFGHFSIDSSGAWSYTLDDSKLAVQELNSGDTRHDLIEVATADGTVHQIDVTINGADDFLFDDNANTVNFNTVSIGTYVAGTQYDALGGDDIVTLPGSNALASQAGFDSTQTFFGGDGNDNITAGGSLDYSIDGGRGNDTVNGGAGNDTIVMLVTTAGDVDEAHGGLNTPTIVDGTLVPGRDTLVLTGVVPGDGTVELRLFESDQVASIGGNADSLVQDGFENLDASELDGFVVATGSNGGNEMRGTNGADVLSGSGGDDSLFGEGNNDALHGGNGEDLLMGDVGNDALFGDADSDVVIGGMGSDTLDGGDGPDSLFGDDGDDNPIGGNDILIGGPGDDYLDGGAGADTMYGGDDTNTLIGGPGDDYLVGGAGSDTFVYTALSDADAGTAGDFINDFEQGSDKLNLYDLLFSIGAPHDPAAPAFSDFLRFTTDSSGNTLVEVDGDGGGNSWVTLATVAGVSLTLDDIIL